jgi:3-oxoacyl-[acyl-carrier-protein] synthase II
MVFNPWAGNNAQGIGEAFRAIQNGELDCALVGGADSKAHYVGFVTFSQHNLLSKKGICCPFDENRDGLILSEGSCFLVLEKLEIAQKRDAKIYAEIIGYGEATDWESQGFFSENVQILEKAMKNALNDANIEPYQVDYINASANSHPIGDFTEGKAIMNLFNNKPVVNSTKALTNELGAASASFELAVCAMAIKNKTIPPTVNLNTPDKRLRLNFGSKETQREEINIGLTNSFELGSSKVTLILRKYL